MRVYTRSLWFKLTLAFLLVSVMGAVLVALLVNWQTQRQFDTLVQQIYQEDLANLNSQLTTYYQENNSWDGIEAILFNDRPADPAEFKSEKPPSRQLPVTLVDKNGMVVFGDRHFPRGEELPESIINQGLPITVNDETVGWIIMDSFREGGDITDSPEAQFLVDLNRSTIWSALIAGGVALVLSIWLAGTISRPIHELKIATEQVAQGELGTQVAVHSADEIGDLTVSFNQMSTDLARANDLRRQMTADIAHDLRTPLSVIQGYTEALDEGKLPGTSEIYGSMHKQVLHLNRLVEDLRTLSLADAGQLSLYPQEVAPRDILEHSVLVYVPQAEQQQVTLSLEIPDMLPRIVVDPDRIVQVLGNLISNALRHTPAGGEIRLAAQSVQDEIVVEVQDTGAGIPLEDLPYVFDRFYKGDKSRSESGESGLGLAIARSIVEAHKGHISVSSTPGQGTTFTISLPVPQQTPK